MNFDDIENRCGDPNPLARKDDLIKLAKLVHDLINVCIHRDDNADDDLNVRKEQIVKLIKGEE